MMLIARRNGMAVKTKWKNPYVTDGLVAMWDGEWNSGIDTHDPNATTWVDLSGNGYDMSLANSESPIWYDKYCWLQGKSYFVSNRVVPEAKSIEVSYYTKDDITRGEMVYFRQSNIQVAVYNTKFIVALITAKNMPSYKKGKHTVGVVKNSGDWVVYSDGVSDITGSRDFYSGSQSGSYIGAGTYGVSDATHGNKYRQGIFCVRLYSQAISADEIAHNYAVDKIRFNLP